MFADYAPDLVLNSVSGSSLLPGLPVSIYTPVDTSCTLVIRDPLGKENWMRFSARNYYQLVSPSTPAANYFQELQAEMLLPGDSIPCFKSKPGCAAFMIANEPLTSQTELSWNKGVYLRRSLLLACNNPAGEKYLPFSRRLPGQAPCYGWVLLEFSGANSITIKSAAINLSPGRPILCGQTK